MSESGAPSAETLFIEFLEPSADAPATFHVSVVKRALAGAIERYEHEVQVVPPEIRPHPDGYVAVLRGLSPPQASNDFFPPAGATPVMQIASEEHRDGNTYVVRLPSRSEYSQVTERGLVDAFERFFNELLALRRVGRRARSEPTLEMKIEDLSRYVEILIDERAALRQALAAAHNDLAVAETKIEQLELLIKLLHTETYGVKEKRDKGFIGHIVLGIATVLAPMGAVALEHRLDDAHTKAMEATREVVVDCGDTYVINRYEELLDTTIHFTSEVQDNVTMRDSVEVDLNKGDGGSYGVGKSNP